MTDPNMPAPEPVPPLTPDPKPADPKPVPPAPEDERGPLACQLNCPVPRAAHQYGCNGTAQGWRQPADTAS
jgi:hypothetical protein